MYFTIEKQIYYNFINLGHWLGSWSKEIGRAHVWTPHANISYAVFCL